ncbi:MAG TPA: mechanosensitive ion channel family protein [bacterium]|nr:mechanosensitive ion channel family protein [bacterium]HQL64055.1 mechanosensitive ion channel family protein [bacterium]
MKRIILNPLVLLFTILILSAGLQTYAGPQLSPFPATPEIAPSTVESSTRPADILDAADTMTQRIVGSVSETIVAAKDLLVGAAGGEQSTLGVLMGSFLSIFTMELLDRPLWLYILSLFIVLAAFFFRRVVARLFGLLLQRLAARTKTSLDDHAVKAILPCLQFAVTLLGVYVALQVFFAGQPIPVPPVTALDWFRQFFRSVLYLLLLGNAAWVLMNLTDVVVTWISHWSARTDFTIDETFLPIGRRIIKWFIIIAAFLQALDYLEFDAVVNSLLAAAGIGGLAVGLAAQDTIKNFFGSVVLLLDRPFSSGDMIVAGNAEGEVESVGLRSTRIRTFEKTLVTIPNSSIVDRDIENLSRRPVRRVNMTIGVTYSTKPEEMESLLQRIKDLLRNDPGVWQGLMLVRFQNFGPSSLEILLYYFTRSTNWDEYLEVRERINLGIMRIIEEMGLEIAFPTQTIHLFQEEKN